MAQLASRRTANWEVPIACSAAHQSQYDQGRQASWPLSLRVLETMREAQEKNAGGKILIPGSLYSIQLQSTTYNLNVPFTDYTVCCYYIVVVHIPTGACTCHVFLYVILHGFRVVCRPMIGIPRACQLAHL
jgi:hypothetical protein